MTKQSITNASPPAEFRGIWIPYWDMDSAVKIEAHVKRAAAMNANAMLFQVVARGDAYYNSNILPRAESIADSNIDPLNVAIASAKKYGLKVHAWINALLVWTSSTPPKSMFHVVNNHPDWLMIDPYGEVQFNSVSDPNRDYEEGYYLDPGLEDVRNHLRSIYVEVLNNYEIDGIHFDYIRHPNRVGVDATRLSYRPDTISAFHAQTVLDPCGGTSPCKPILEWTAEWDQWREDQITLLVQGIADDVRKNIYHPSATVSAATLARWDIGQGRSFTSGRSWIQSGELDFICPMCYYTNNEWVVHYTKSLLEVTESSRVYTGLAAYLNSPQALVKQILATRAAGAGGQIIFSASDLTDKHIKLLAGSKGPWSQPASIPPLYHRSINLGSLPSLPRPVPFFTLGMLEFNSEIPTSLSLIRDFYVRRGKTFLHIIQQGNTPVTDINLTINGHTISVNNDILLVDISSFVHPATTTTYTDNHTSSITVQGSGKSGARAIFSIEDTY